MHSAGNSCRIKNKQQAANYKLQKATLNDAKIIF
jgi:hypothetical protein